MRLQGIASKLGGRDPPDEPVYDGSYYDSNAHDTVQPVRQRRRVPLASRRAQEGRHELKRLAHHIKDGNGPPDLEGAFGLGLTPPQMEEAHDNKKVDDGTWIAFQVEDKVVGVFQREWPR